MRHTGATIIVRLLEIHGIQTVSGIPGGSILPLQDALAASKIRYVLARHEQGAAFVAQGMARASGRTAVCMASSGPGALNLLTALADADRDRVPLVAITGQVSRPLLDTEAFQEADMVALARPLTRKVWQLRRAKDLLWILPKAFRVAAGNRPGAVLIDVPKDVQQEWVEFGHWPRPWCDRPLETGDLTSSCGRRSWQTAADRVARLLVRSKRPLILAGGGCVASPAGAANLAVVVEATGIPVVQTLMGLGCLPAGHPALLGMIGMHGSPGANLAVADCDLLIALGVRFDDRACGRLADFAPQARVVAVNPEAGHLRIPGRRTMAVPADAGSFLKALAQSVGKLKTGRTRAGAIPGSDTSASRAHREFAALSHSRGLGRQIQDSGVPRWIFDCLPSDREVTVCTDVGQHQMWTALYYGVSRPRQFLTSGGMGTMGFGLPAAIGAALARPAHRVICISGDGSIMMNIQELALLGELDLDVTILVLNNRHLGLVRQQQDLFHEARHHGCAYERPSDLVAIARGFGLEASRVEHGATLKAILEVRGPRLVDIPVHHGAMVFPMVAPGQSNTKMLGLLDPPVRGRVETGKTVLEDTQAAGRMG